MSKARCTCPDCVCPEPERHTAAPHGHLAWHHWAGEKSRTHDQIRCSACDRLAIWVPKEEGRTVGVGS